MTENPLSAFGSLPLAIEAEYYDRPYGNQKPYAIENGIALIDISGALTKSASLFEKLIFGATSYEDITDQLELASEDTDVKAIMLRVNSPGGTVSGMFQACRAIASARQSKTVWAVADELACSAAYLLASAAEKIYVAPDTGCLGSIGVIAQRVDVTEMDKQNGIKLHIVQAGKQKAYGNPHTPMSKDEQEQLQAQVDRMYGMFVDAVSRNRGISAAQVRATEAGVFMGQAAIDQKLADVSGSFEDAMEALRSHADGKSKRTSGQRMSGEHSMSAPAAMTSQTEVPVEDTTQLQETAAAETQETAAAAGTETTAAEATQIEQAAPEATSVDTEAALAAARTAGYDAAVEIADLCALAGKPELAAGFITGRKTAADVRSALLAGRASAQAATQVNSQVPPATGVTATTSVQDNPIVRACEQIAKAATKGAN